MVNMAGGVMENAGLSLDRYGMPIIPGSAVKGCARRAALAALREWCDSSTKPESDDNLFSKLCAHFTTPVEMLNSIALTFGWVEKDWSEEKADQSDFVWACEHAMDVFRSVAKQIDHKQTAGRIAFFHAQPNRDPGLVLDVLTTHHKDYYESTNPNAIATDDEDPVPVFFPAIREQNGSDHFTFPLIPLRKADESLLAFAHASLCSGLEVFGIGAKTNAGYGWFEDITEKVKTSKDKEKELESARSNVSIADELRAKPKDHLRGILNKFEFDNERFWPQQEPENTAEFQVTLLVLHLEDTALLADAMSAKKAKKALQNLAKKFKRPLP
jgi:CRISPR type III-B/RAMP module RAMP protein Cmr6